MSIDNVPVGNPARIRMVFRDVDQTLTDPEEVTVKVTDPAGTETVYTLTGTDVERESQGVFHLDVDIDSQGTWRWVSIGTGAVDAERSGVINAFDHYASP